MSSGEGILLVLEVIVGTIVATAIAAAFLSWIAALTRTQAERQAHAGGSKSSAPVYRGRCRCAGCRTRPQEPCSDYDGD